MQRQDRLLKLHRLLTTARYPVPRQRLVSELACSEATVYRVIADLRDGLGAPIRTLSDQPAYYYDPDANRFELPGLWFSAAELYALLAADHLLGEVEPGLMHDTIETLRSRIQAALGNDAISSVEALGRIRILSIGTRHPHPTQLRNTAQAVLERRQLWIRYTSRSEDERSERTVSPQRLTHYRDNWYLDAWCHARKGLRVFAVDRIDSIQLKDDPARQVTDDVLDNYLGSAYGIFAGEPDQNAVLRFSRERARWVADEHWHPKQCTRWLPDGRFELTVPFRRSEELIMDVLKYGPDVEVVAPATLRENVYQRLSQAWRVYDPAH